MAASENTSLFKFCDTDTSLKILNSQSLRWSSPHLFNDPYELSHRCQLAFTEKALLRGLILEAVEMLFGPGNLAPSDNDLITTIARWRDEKRFNSADEAEAVLTELLAKKAASQFAVAMQYIQQWQQHVSALRICCFSDRADNINAWQRFGDNHHGVVLELATKPGTAQHNPKKVRYSNKPPQLLNLDQQVDIVYGRQNKLSTRQFVKNSLSKNRNNNKEGEWRCFISDNEGAALEDYLWYSNTKFAVGDLKTVYLGQAISAEDRAAVLNLVKHRYPKTPVYRTQPRPGSYHMDFSQVPKI